MATPYLPSRRTAFTVIELCVSIGLVVLIFALSLPIASSLRNHLYRTTCAGHLRQIANALLNYSVDHNGRLISAWETPYKRETLWTCRLGPYMGAAPKLAIGADYMRCPAQPDLPTTYGLHYSGGKGVFTPTPLFALRQESGLLASFRPDTFLVADASGPLIYSPSVWPFNSLDGTSSDKHPRPYNYATFPHQLRMNAAFVDGSVRIITLTDWKEGVGELRPY